MKIILAVSGGVDSAAMLHSLINQDGFAQLKFSKVKYIVAHFDHGIRSDSWADERFVRLLAKKYGLDYEAATADLGKTTSEAKARKARWYFLSNLKNKHQADFIATAHHSDDVFETQLINLLRGTGRRGVSVLQNTDAILRPLRTRTKSEIYDYALESRLEYVEDETNLDPRYLRNNLRMHVIPKLNPKIKAFLANVELLNPEIDKLLSAVADDLISQSNHKIIIERAKFRPLPPQIQREVIRYAIEQVDIVHAKQKISAAMINRLVNFALRPDSNRYLHISKSLQAYIPKTELIIEKL